MKLKLKQQLATKTKTAANPGKGAVAGAPKNIYSLTPIFHNKE